MPHRPPLTAERLAEIWDDHPSPVVLELLWEIHRLRSTILRADQVRKELRPYSHMVAGGIWDCFERDLDKEPCLTDLPTQRQQALSDWLVDRRNRQRKTKD